MANNFFCRLILACSLAAWVSSKVHHERVCSNRLSRVAYLFVVGVELGSAAVVHKLGSWFRLHLQWPELMTVFVSGRMYWPWQVRGQWMGREGNVSKPSWGRVRG
jgi:hypothetical protein